MRKFVRSSLHPRAGCPQVAKTQFEMHVSEVPIQDHYLISQQSEKTDYSDNFQLKTDVFKRAPEPKECMIAFFKSFPPFFTKMLLFREAVANKLGLKTADKTTHEQRMELINNFKGEIGESIAIFEVLDKNEMELLTGQKDKHLDFKLSFISTREGQQSVVELATTVVIHNLMGKAYFFFVRPIHRLYMKRIMKRMGKELEKNVNAAC